MKERKSLFANYTGQTVNFTKLYVDPYKIGPIGKIEIRTLFFKFKPHFKYYINT